MDRCELLEKAPIATVFLKYALPSIITMCFFGLQNLVDGYVVGNYVSEKALGGVNIITPLFSFVMVVAMIVSIGCQTLGSIVIAILRGVVFIGIGMLILPTFLGERGIWLTLVLSEVLTLAVSIFLARRSVVFNE